MGIPPSFLLIRFPGNGMNQNRSSRKTFTIATLGCKLNQYESECLRERLVHQNWIYRRFDEGAAFYIINSCTVTGKTDARTRNCIRRARRASPGATIIVTGCYAVTQPQELQSMPEVDLVVGNGEKRSIPLLMNRIIAGEDCSPRGTHSHPPDAPIDFHMIDSFLDHSRAFIKIQEGCNASCSYCIIPAARGSSRSVPQQFVMDQVWHLEQRGYDEVVLTGIHIGRYGRDMECETNLTGLVHMLLDGTERVRLRLSSIEVTEITDGLISLISETDRVAPHLHIPLQSGDDNVLSAMKRPYHSALFGEMIEKLKNRIPSMSVGTDIIVGFPGETDAQFRNTYLFVRDLPISYFHVFNFSRRPGTVAFTMPEQVPADVRKRRSVKLRKLGNSKRRAFMKSIIGTRENAIIQGGESAFSRFSRALTGNYCEVLVRCSSRLSGKLVPITVTHYSSGRLYGNVKEPESRIRRAGFREHPR